MPRAVLFDTETTGLDPKDGHRIVEIAALELVNDLPTGQRFHTEIDPERDVPDDAVRIHGLAAAQLAGKPRFAAITGQLLQFLGDGPLIAHNAPFDFAFLNAEFARLGAPALAQSRMVDTLAIAKRRFPGMPNSLDALCRRFSIDLSARTTHNALLDCKLLAQVYLELTGGRQRGLTLEGAPRQAPVVSYVREAARTLRPIVPRTAELVAHRALLAQLKEPLWLISDDASPPDRSD